MKKFALLAALALLWPLQSNAEIVVVQAKGYGDTYEQAVESALGDAVKQASGARVATRSASPQAYMQIKDAKENRSQGTADTSLKKEGKRSEEHTSKLQSLMRNSNATFR